ncbi:unnamed protein product [Echinostoma caproni]|uniref:SH3 domain-containing protein n=1 Tax=Echinostoma caproni TaxID=27848 RepID=A0A183A7G1_9TREM|nr:unnamed protein product [Echinostoma caproni]
MALNCFKLKEAELERVEEIQEGSRPTARLDALSKPSSQSPCTDGTTPLNDSGSTRFDKPPRKSGTYDNTQRCRSAITGRHPGFHSSTFSSCISAKSETKESTYSALDSSKGGNCFRQPLPSQTGQITELDPPNAQLCQSHFTPQTTGTKTKAFGCLVRSQSDSTCLSIKTHKSSATTELRAKVDTGRIGVTDNNHRPDDVPYDSLSSIADTSTLDPLHSSSSELDAYPVSVEIFPHNDLSHRSGFYDPMNSCTESPIESEITKPFRPVPATRTYQLVCRDGVQSYEVVTSTHIRESSLGSDCNTRLSDDSCASPVLSQKNHSEISNVLTDVKHGQHRSSQSSGTVDSKVRSVWPSQRHGPTESTEYTYAYGDSSNSSYVSNRQNSGGSSDLTTPSSPRRSPRPTATGESTRVATAASGTQAVNLYNPHHGYVRQATVVQAPANGTVPSTCVVEGVSSSSGSSTAASKRAQSYSSQPPPRNSPDRFAVPSDTGSEMTVSELRSIAERQRQQLSRQAHQIQSREERLAYLRATQAGRESSDKVPSTGSELTHEQETRLQKLRNYRGQTERTRLTNDNLGKTVQVILVKEIDNFARLLSSNELELEACRRRKEEAQPNSPGQPNTTKAKGNEAASAELERPVDLLSFQFPFASDRDKKRWRDGLMEADYLDRQIALALSHNGPVQRGPISPASTEYDVSRMPSSRSCKSSTTIPASTAAHSGKPNTGPSLPPGDPTGMASQQTTSSGFSSLLSRASSPPTSRRTSLRMLLHAANSTGAYSSNSKTPGAASQTGGVTFSFPRLKAPPRYASRAVINETYMRRIRRDRVENYKRTANEIYRANVDRMASKQQQLSTPTTTEPRTESRSSSQDQSSLGSIGSTITASEGQVGSTDEAHRFPSHEPGTVQQSSPLDSVTSSSSSSLELVGIESPGLSIVKGPQPGSSSVDEEAKHSQAEVDSGLGGSDDTGPSERTQASASNEPQDANDHASNAVVYVIDDLHGPELSQTTTSHIKPILRKSPKSPSGHSKKAGDSGADVTSDATASSQSSQCRSNSVRFHPLALLLDAALEGDIDLVKKAAAQVSDVSEPNDEGITALHNAVCAGRMDIAEFLVRTAGADVNAGDTDGWTPLHCAASCANLPLARLLVEHGASLHARTLSDQETPLEKCDQGDDEAECEEYLYFQQERLGSAASGRVYVLFPRGLEAAGPGSADAHVEPDELSVRPNEPLTIIDREPLGETEWMLAEKADGTRGLIPRSHISCYPLVRIPPASLPIPLRAPKPRRFEWWDDEDVDGSGDAGDGDENDEDAEAEPEDEEEDLTVPADRACGSSEDPRSPVLVEVDTPQRETPDVDLIPEPVSSGTNSTEPSHTKSGMAGSAAGITISSRLTIDPVEKSTNVRFAVTSVVESIVK